MTPTTPTPSSPGDALTAHQDQLVGLERFGRAVLAGDMQSGVYRDLAWQASRLYAALYVLQADGVRGADEVDLDPIEDLAALLQRLSDDAVDAGS